MPSPSAPFCGREMKAPGSLGQRLACSQGSWGVGTTYTPLPGVRGALEASFDGHKDPGHVDPALAQPKTRLPGPAPPQAGAAHWPSRSRTCPRHPARARTQAPAGHARRANFYGGPGAAPEQNRPAAADGHASSPGGCLPDSREGRPGPRVRAAWPLGWQAGAMLRPGAAPPAWAQPRPPRPLQTGLCAGCAGRLAPL